MSTRTSRWPAGVPCWADLTVPDLAGVVPFYEAVLGWTVEAPAPEFGGYSIATVDGVPAAGIGPQQQAGTPPAWTLYFASDDVDATAEQIRHQGGLVLLPPGDVGDLGRLLLATDPTGAAFGVWQAGTHIGAGIVNEPGGLTWEDLRSPDPATAQGFYAAVFGHRMQTLEMGGPEYVTFHLGDDEAPLGGMGDLMGAPAPHWLVYFAVADTDASVAAAESNGGQVPMPAFDSPFGRLATLTDPVGAVFCVIEPDASAQPDRSG